MEREETKAFVAWFNNEENQSVKRRQRREMDEKEKLIIEELLVLERSINAIKPVRDAYQVLLSQAEGSSFAIENKDVRANNREQYIRLERILFSEEEERRHRCGTLKEIIFRKPHFSLNDDVTLSIEKALSLMFYHFKAIIIAFKIYKWNDFHFRAPCDPEELFDCYLSIFHFYRLLVFSHLITITVADVDVIISSLDEYIGIRSPFDKPPHHYHQHKIHKRKNPLLEMVTAI